MIKLLIGGSPCTHWSISQSKNRETKAEGLGWELFLNFVIAKEKFKPDFFLYENNWSASKEIKDQIQKELDCELMRINSKLVSAQNRDRFYVFNWDVKQPEDRGILLQNILESGIAYLDKCQCLTATYSKQTVSEAQFAHSLEKKMRTMVAIPLNITFSEKHLKENMPIYKVENGLISIKDKLYPIKLDDGYYVIRKLTPVECERLQTMPCTKTALLFDFEKMEVYSEKWFIEHQNRNARSVEGKCLRSQRLVSLAERLEESEFALYVEKKLSSNYRQTEKPAHLNARISTEESNSPTECSGVTLNSVSTAEKNLEFRKVGQSEDFAQLIVGMHSLLTKTQHLGKVELHQNGKFFAIAENGKMQLLLSGEEIMQLAEDVAKNTNTSLKHIISTISEVGQSTKNLEQILTTLFFFALNATDMFTQIKTQKKVLLLTEREYTAAVSNTQRYKGLGNGWTAEVIIHILQGALKDVPRDEKIVVLSMYDGIGTGRYCLDKMGFTNVEYHAYEIDKYAIKVAMSNYPDIIQHGDAFQVRNQDWKI